MKKIELDIYTRCGFCLNNLAATASAPERGFCRVCRIYWTAEPSALETT